jgi:hypothetical protein
MVLLRDGFKCGDYALTFKAIPLLNNAVFFVTLKAQVHRPNALRSSI